jgi:hypothetical protein
MRPTLRQNRIGEVDTADLGSIRATKVVSPLSLATLGIPFAHSVSAPTGHVVVLLPLRVRYGPCGVSVRRNRQCRLLIGRSGWAGLRSSRHHRVSGDPKRHWKHCQHSVDCVQHCSLFSRGLTGRVSAGPARRGDQDGVAAVRASMALRLLKNALPKERLPIVPSTLDSTSPLRFLPSRMMTTSTSVIPSGRRARV